MKKLVMVGMNQRTRSAIPWDGYNEIWVLNELAENDWCKRWNVLFQLHPRSDWERTNNMASPNHPLFIKGISGPCIFCAGSGKAHDAQSGDEIACPYCKEGQYELPAHRTGKTIVMQDDNKDVPGCVRLPIEELKHIYCQDEIPYFTSTLAHMVVYAMWRDYKDIELYGFEMESGTEYANQRACVEYWIGFGRALGIHIEAPGANILKGPHYAYESIAQGYRTRLEMRIRSLNAQLNAATGEALKAEGALQAITPFRAIAEVSPAWDQRFDDHFRKKAFVSFIEGTIHETENLMKLWDAFHGEGVDANKQQDLLIAKTYELG
jgi:hypothetical protein